MQQQIVLSGIERKGEGFGIPINGQWNSDCDGRNLQHEDTRLQIEILENKENAWGVATRDHTLEKSGIPTQRHIFMVRSCLGSGSDAANTR